MAEEPIDVEEEAAPAVSAEDVPEATTVAKRRTRQKNTREFELNDLHSLMNTYAGRHFLWQLLSYTEFYSVYFSSDATLMARNAGKRLIGAWVLDEMHSADPSGKLYQQMRSEAGQRHVEKKS